MIAIVPIFLHAKEDFWNGIVARKLLVNFFDMLKNVAEIKNCFVFSDQASFVDLAESAGLSGFRIDIDEDSSELFPSGTLSSTDYIASNLNIDLKDVMVIDFRKPFINSSSIRDSVFMYYKNPGIVLISVKPSVDHPCQLELYYRILDISLIHLIDSGEIKRMYTERFVKRFNENKIVNIYEDCFITRPFYFDWASRGYIDCETGMYERSTDKTGVRYLPCECCRKNGHDIQGPSFWLKDNDSQARVLYFFNNHDGFDTSKIYPKASGYTVAGAGFVDNYSDLLWVLYADHRRERCCLILKSDIIAPDSIILNITPINESDSVNMLSMETSPDELLNGIFFDLDCSDMNGVVCSLICAAEDGSYDFKETFPCQKDLWTSGARKINVKTGREITGRQDFPDVFERDGAILIAPLDAFARLKNDTYQTNFQGFESGSFDSIHVECELDLLKYKALCKADPGI